MLLGDAGLETKVETSVRPDPAHERPFRMPGSDAQKRSRSYAPPASSLRREGRIAHRRRIGFRRLRSIVMNAIVTALIVFAVLMGATLLGSALGRRLPTDQVTGATWSSVSLGLGFISTMAAIVLGLLVASAKRIDLWFLL